MLMSEQTWQIILIIIMFLVRYDFDYTILKEFFFCEHPITRTTEYIFDLINTYMTENSIECRKSLVI